MVAAWIPAFAGMTALQMTPLPGMEEYHVSLLFNDKDQAFIHPPAVHCVCFGRHTLAASIANARPNPTQLYG
jgi:hypothetical protein